MPFLGALGAGSVRSYGRGLSTSIILSGTFYNNFSAVPATLAEANGTARVVLNGYGLLLYGWTSQLTGTNMRSITLPAGLLGKQVDITYIGGGGYHLGGGGGGAGGAGGGRHLTTLTTLQAYIKTGTNVYSATSATDSTPGTDEWRNTRMYLNNGADVLYSPHASTNTGSTATGGNVYNYTGPGSATASSLSSSNATNLATVQAKDSTFQYCYGGTGVGLNGFTTSFPDGSDLGGGGGAQDSVNYGGTTAPGNPGRYGYIGGLRGAAGGGPVGGLVVTLGTYQKGAGGSFGAGCGDAGNADTTMTPGGGAILIRWDTTLGTFQTGRPGWP